MGRLDGDVPEVAITPGMATRPAARGGDTPPGSATTQASPGGASPRAPAMVIVGETEQEQYKKIQNRQPAKKHTKPNKTARKARQSAKK